MTPEEAYEEALRRIREAEKTGAIELDLRLSDLIRLPPDLKRLTSLQSLKLERCRRLSGDLTSLACLTFLQTLDLSYCEQISDLSPLAGLMSLQRLYLGSQ